jgi:hypothetical protein
MKLEKQMKKCYSQLVVEGLIRAIVIGLTIGFLTGFLVFLVGIILVKDLKWIGLAVSLAVSLLSGALLYRFRFRPSIPELARRIDRLGFEERAITMVELSNEQSYIAKVQREDTNQVLNRFALKVASPALFVKPLIAFVMIAFLMFSSFTIMMNTVKAAEIVDPPIDELSPDDKIFQQMIDDLLAIISNANIDISLKGLLYGMVVNLERRLPLYDTYLQKYQDVYETRNEILQLIADAVIEVEESLMNIAEALQKYDNTETLGTAIATWNDEEIIAAFDAMYARIEVLLGQELYDVMWQTALDIEAALAEAVGTDPGMHEALQELADAYKLALDGFEAGEEPEMLEGFKGSMDGSLASLLEAIQALRDLIEELLELEEDIEEAVDQVDQFPIFMPYPEDGEEGTDPGDPNTHSENTVIDGLTPYEDVYDSYYEDAMSWLTSESISEEIRRMIQGYFDMLSSTGD